MKQFTPPSQEAAYDVSKNALRRGINTMLNEQRSKRTLDILRATKMLIGSGPLLMVDDDRADIYIARMCLQRSILKKEIQPLDSGKALIEYLEAARDRHELPCLILLDINMPGLNGFETLMRVREMRGFECLPPVTILSSSDDPRDIERGARLGAEYVTKPIDMEAYVEFFDSLAA